MSGYNTRQVTTKPKPPQFSAKSPGGKSIIKSKDKVQRLSESSPSKKLSDVNPANSAKDNENRYVCSVCNNSESVRNARLKLETDLLTNTLTKISEVKSSLTEHADQIETLDLHVQHLLLDRTKFEHYQDRVASIDINCNQILSDIAILTKCKTNVDPINVALSESDISIISSKISDSFDIKLDSNLEILSKHIDNLNSELNKVISESSQSPVANSSMSEELKSEFANINGQLNVIATNNDTNTKTLKDTFI